MAASEIDNRKSTGEVILSLLDQLNEQGAGVVDGDVLPARPKSQTSAKKRELYAKLCVKVMEKLKDVIEKNSKFTTDDGKTPRFIAHPDGVIKLSVPADK